MTDVSATLKLGFDGLGSKLDTHYKTLADFIEREKVRGEKVMRLPLGLQGAPVAGVLTLGEAAGEVCGPDEGFAWSIRRLVVDGLAAASGGVTTVYTATGAVALGAGSAALPAFVSVTGFTVSFTSATTSAGTATLSNVTGGPYVFNIPSGSTNYAQNFPAPITATGAATLTIAGVGAAISGTIVLYGTFTTLAVSADVVTLYRGTSGTPPLWTFSGLGSSPGPQFTYEKGSMILMPGDKLSLSGTITATGTIRLSGMVKQVPAEMIAKVS